MAHGQPDHGRSSGLVTTFQLQDLGELSARDNQAVTYDRRGDLYVLDDFEAATIKWNATVNGNGAASARSTAQAFRGDASWLLTHGDSIGDVSNISKTFALPRVSRLGLEVKFSADTLADGLFTIAGIYFDGSNSHTFQVRVDMEDNQIQLADENADFQDIIAYTPTDQPNRFHHLKLVMDLALDTYVRLLFNNTETDVTATAMTNAVSAGNARAVITLSHEAISAVNRSLYIDDFLFTQNEP